MALRQGIIHFHTLIKLIKVLNSELMEVCPSLLSRLEGFWVEVGGSLVDELGALDDHGVLVDPGIRDGVLQHDVSAHLRQVAPEVLPVPHLHRLHHVHYLIVNVDGVEEQIQKQGVECVLPVFKDDHILRIYHIQVSIVQIIAVLVG